MKFHPRCMFLIARERGMPGRQNKVFNTLFPSLRQLVVFLWVSLLAVHVPSTTTSALSSSPTPPPAKIALEEVIAEGLSKPVFLTHAGDKSGRLFVVEQVGRILIMHKTQLLKVPFLDITTRIVNEGERGLLGLAFHPHYSRNGRFFVYYTREQDAATVVAEYHVSTNPKRADTKEKILLIVPQPYGNHNGGMIAFGIDGYLYIGLGDGGSGGDPGNRAQNPSELLGKILRIDIDGDGPYSIPSTNPYATGGGRSEIFASGFRNPWRFSIDHQTGELWAGDVGQHDWEEIDLVEVGGNYGWRIMEGKHCYNPAQDCPTERLILPVTEYANAGGRCAVTGGYVYRGRQVSSIKGTYVFGDFCSGEIFGLRETNQEVLLDSNLQISSFGEDEDGEMFVLGHSGSIHRIANIPQ